jgi:hypothetical protein
MPLSQIGKIMVSTKDNNGKDNKKKKLIFFENAI